MLPVMQADGRNARYLNEQILRLINAILGRVPGQIEHPLGALDPARRGSDTDDERVDMAVDLDVGARRAFAVGAKAVPGEDDGIARYSRRRAPPYERRRVLRLHG